MRRFRLDPELPGGPGVGAGDGEIKTEVIFNRVIAPAIISPGYGIDAHGSPQDGRSIDT